MHGLITDLVLAIEEMPHPTYTRKENDLIYTQTLSLGEALNCGSIQVLTLDFRNLSVSIDSIVR